MDDPAPLCVALIAADPLARAGLRVTLEQRGVAVVQEEAPHPELSITAEAQLVVWDDGPQPNGDAPPDGDYPVLALVADAERAAELLSLGASGALLRDGDGPRLVAALHAVHAGLTVVDDAFAGTVFAAAPTADPEADGLVPLTVREAEVLDLLAEGLSNKDVALALAISPNTVKFHVNAILTKLDAQTRTEAVTRAARTGLLKL